MHFLEQTYRRTIIRLIHREGVSSVLNYLQPAKGSLVDNRKYCTKEGNFWEHGELPNYLLEKEKQNHRLVLMEDFLLDGKYLAQHLKIWADRYCFTSETKGGLMVVNPGTFFLIVTSNYSIDEVFDGIDSSAIQRRFASIEIRSQGDIQLKTELPSEILGF